MENETKDAASFVFPTDVVDDWPPVSSESLPFARCAGGYRALVCPLFVKGLSVDDVVDVDLDANQHVSRWRHIFRSRRSAIWILRLAEDNGVEEVLSRLRAIRCNTVGVDEFGSYAVDVPESVHLDTVDPILEYLDENSAGVAFASLRHEEKD